MENQANPEEDLCNGEKYGSRTNLMDAYSHTGACKRHKVLEIHAENGDNETEIMSEKHHQS